VFATSDARVLGRRCAVLAYSLLNAPGAGIAEHARVTDVVSVSVYLVSPIGEHGLVSAPKLTNLYRKSGMST